MKIESSTVVKLTITEAIALDPITVILEDISSGRGKIIIECYGKSWSACWGGMGARTVSQFFRSCNEDYLAEYLSDIAPGIVDSESIKGACVKSVLAERRRRVIGREEARELYTEIEFAVVGDDGWADPKLMQKVFGDEWWYSLPSRPNPNYAYLCRIIRAVQDALQQCEQTAVTACRNAPCDCTPDERAACRVCGEGGLIDQARKAVDARQARVKVKE